MKTIWEITIEDREKNFYEELESILGEKAKKSLEDFVKGLRLQTQEKVIEKFAQYMVNNPNYSRHWKSVNDAQRDVERIKNEIREELTKNR